MKTPQEIEHEQALADTRGRVDIGIEQFRWIYELALAALKSAMLINGGAAIALLAFLGNLASNEIGPNTAAPFSRALFFFIGGMAVTAIGMGSIHFTQSRTLGEWVIFAARASRLPIIVSIFVALALVLFALGVWQSYDAIFVQSMSEVIYPLLD